MKKRIFAAAVAVLFLSAQAFCATYYVSPAGDDSNDGLSAKTPWATIKRVNQAKEIQPGDEILWKRGGIWRGILLPHSGEPGNPVRYGAYGKGDAKPTFYGSLSASQEKDWVEVSPNIWATREMETKILGDLDGNFSQGWSVYVEKPADVQLKQELEDGKRKLTLNFKDGGKAQNHVQIWGPKVDAEKYPESMLVQMKVRASRPLTIPGPRVSLQKAPWTGKVSANSFNVTEDWQTVDVLLTRNDSRLPDDSYSFVWHWSIGGIPADTQLEVVFLGLKEIFTDRSLYLSADVGNIIFDHGTFKKYHYCGMKKWKMEDLKAPGDYFYDPTLLRVFLYWDENPAKTCESIELALRKTVIDQSGKHDVLYEDLAVAYGAAHGFGGANTARLTIRGCDLYFIGGGHQHTNEHGRPVRFGNAIEFWNSAEDHLVENCKIWEVYDAALTNQGKGTEASPSIQKNITYRNNWIEKSEYSFEYWNRNSVTENILFEDNYCVDAGVCWSHSQRPNPNGAHLMLYHNSAETKNFVIRGNKFLNSTEVCLRMDNDWRAGLKMEKNEYQQTEELPVIRWLVHTYYGTDTFSGWQTECGMDQESVCTKK